MNPIKNRNDSFYSQIEKFGSRRKSVYNLIKEYGSLTTHEIKDKMRLGKHQISGRITELQQGCFIKPVWNKLNKVTNVINTVWQTTTPEERSILIASKRSKLENEYELLQFDLNSIYISNFARELIIKRMTTIKKLINKL